MFFITVNGRIVNIIVNFNYLKVETFDKFVITEGLHVKALNHVCLNINCIRYE